jgi:LCP family protein required for cell wall assembly
MTPSHLRRARQRTVRLIVDLGLARATVVTGLPIRTDDAGLSERWTVLLVGSDRRAPAGGVSGARADAMVLAAYDTATNDLAIVQIPRDVWTDLPGIGYQKTGWALDYGGASCLIGAVSGLVGSPIDHYVEVEFQGFVELVDALRGIDFAIDGPARDRLADLQLAAGSSRLDGTTALAVARSRHHDTDGRPPTPLDDTVRMGRQNDLIVGGLRRLRDTRGRLRLLYRLALVARHATIDDRFDADLLMRYLQDVLLARISTFILPVRPTRPQESLRSAFPPHQVNSTNILVLRQPDATLLLKRICSNAEERP